MVSRLCSLYCFKNRHVAYNVQFLFNYIMPRLPSYSLSHFSPTRFLLFICAFVSSFDRFNCFAFFLFIGFISSIFQISTLLRHSRSPTYRRRFSFSLLPPISLFLLFSLPHFVGFHSIYSPNTVVLLSKLSCRHQIRNFLCLIIKTTFILLSLKVPAVASNSAALEMDTITEAELKDNGFRSISN